MIVSFSGDPFLATRAAREFLREQGLQGSELVELGEGMEPGDVARQAAQGGLFGRTALLLDFDAAFRGQAGVKPRNDVLKALESVPDGSLVVVIDTGATAARQKRLRELGEHHHLPTPRFGGLVAWVREELKRAGVRFSREVPEVLADLFGEDLPALASEINKLAVLAEELDGKRVRDLVGRLAARDAFDLIERISSGDAKGAVEVCEALLDQGEAPQKVMGALNWQYAAVARCVALRESRGRLSEGEAASLLGVKPFVAKKSLAIAAKLDEERLRRALRALLEADRAIKRGREDRWALQSLAIALSNEFAAGQAASGRTQRF